MDLGTFIKESCGAIFEVRNRDVEKAITLISKYLRKNRIYTIPLNYEFAVDGSKKLGVYCFNEKNEGAMFVWSLGSTSQIEAVGFTADFNQCVVSLHHPGDTTVFDVYVESKGANTIQMCKVVAAVLTGETKMTVGAVREYIHDAQIFESSNNPIANITESDDAILKDLKRKKNNLYQRINDWKRKGKPYQDLQAEYDELCAKIADARTTIRSNVSVAAVADKEIEEAQSFFEEEERATPEERFDDMKNYIYNVIMGIRPLALLCGAPGVGKTFRVMQAVKGAGKEQNRDYKLLKGKCTPSALYTTLHDFKSEGQLIIMDDCDSVFKDPDAVNLLKAAFDSSDERWVTWGISSKIPMETEIAEMCDDAVYDDVKNRWYYPKEFLYEGGGIVITNYSAGQIDTAVRNRALICDLSFTTQEVLDLIRGLAPKIKSDTIPMSAKESALEYLQELADKKAPVELSIRSFTLCAGLFASNASERSIKRMINEQMRLQFARGGRKH